MCKTVYILSFKDTVNFFFKPLILDDIAPVDHDLARVAF